MRHIALCLAVLGPETASPQEVIVSYAAVIGAHDLTNSRGERLTEVWQILRQDRANLHRFGVRDEGDEWDSVFHDPGARAWMQALVQGGWTDPGAAREILRGDAWVFVTLWGKGGQPLYADVTFTR